MPQIKNKLTGFVANASDADWSGGVYNSSWELVGGGSAPVAPTQVATPVQTQTTALRDFTGQTLQQIADQGYQTSGNNVYSNGKIIGNMTIEQPKIAEGTQQGEKIYKNGQWVTFDRIPEAMANKARVDSGELSSVSTAWTPQNKQQFIDAGFTINGNQAVYLKPVVAPPAPVVPPQVAQDGVKAPYFYGTDVLDKKANNSAVNALYKAYFGRDASASELANWGETGGADTTVRALEDFLKSEQVKYGVEQGTKGITPESMQGTTATNIPTTPDGGTGTADSQGATTAAQSVIDAIKARQDLITQTETEAQKKDTGLGNLISDLTGDLAGSSAYEIAQREAKVNPIEEQLNAVNSEIMAKEAQKATLLAEIQGKPITMSSIIGSQAQVRAVLNAEILTLTARANSLMGNIELAEKQVQQAVDAKYAPIEEAIAIAKAQREAISDIVSKQEKIQIETLNAIDDAKLMAIADAKSAEMAKIDLENKLAINGYKYVATPAERDRLKAQGYDLVEQTDMNGVKRTYARPPEPASSSGSATLSSGIAKVDAERIEASLLSQKGDDGMLHPDDYNLAKSDWTRSGGTAAEFDKKFKERRDVNNPYYNVTLGEGEVRAKNENDIRAELASGKSIGDIEEMGYDRDTAIKVRDEEKEKNKDDKWYQWWK